MTSDILVKLLIIVGHEEAKARELASTMDASIRQMALSYLLTKKEDQVRDEIINKISSGKLAGKEMVAEIIKGVDDKVIEENYLDAVEDVTAYYFEQVFPKLDEEQKAKVKAMMEEVKNNYHQDVYGR